MRTIGPILVLLCMTVQGGDGQKTAFSGWGWLTIGQVVSSQSEQSNGIADLEFEHEWLDNFEAGLRVVSVLGSYTKARLHIMASLQYPVIKSRMSLSLADPLIRRFNILLSEAAIGSVWGFNASRDSLELEFGYLPMKYNPQSRNLGEYLIRSGTYPAYLVSGFEVSDKVKVTGVHAGYRMNTPAGTWKSDGWFTNDMDVYPVHDFSLTLVSGYGAPRNAVDIAAGVNFAHLIVVDERKTYPYKNSDKFPMRGLDPRAAFVDTLTGDTTFYAFRGTKVMGRFAFDPKAFFHAPVLGAEDLKLYGEAAILGVRNYAGWYGNRRERMPAMFGFNLPAFKLLDVLAVEGEYYPMKYWNSTEVIWRSFSPVPYLGLSTDNATPYYPPWKPKTDDDWRWSIYASRRIGPVRISMQAASDHTPRSMWSPPALIRYTEICSNTRDWYWMSRVSFYF